MQAAAACYTRTQAAAACYTRMQAAAACYTRMQAAAAYYTRMQAAAACYTRMQSAAACYTRMQSMPVVLLLVLEQSDTWSGRSNSQQIHIRGRSSTSASPGLLCIERTLSVASLVLL